MSLYLTRAQYSTMAFKGMVTTPSDRGAAARALFDAIGIKTHSIYFSVTSGEVVTIIEGTADQMAEVEMVVMSSGAFSGINSLELVTMEQMNAAMSKAGQTVAKYLAPAK
ncbi:MAG: hypothetical protein ACI9M6_000272 [Hydrogenophaga sp.]|jgi:uncharacterized protein with GYD domain